jgi:D,D-heptose 1,7-bisphosphate phosphatase
MNRAVFLDRDGVLNRKRDDYVKSVDEFVMLENVPEAIRLLNKSGFLTIIITNQSAVNRGYLSHEKLGQIHDFMNFQLKKYDCSIDAIYYCPHTPNENCDCRKPKPGLIRKAIEEHSIDINKSWLIGDSETDVMSGTQIGIKTIQIKTNSDLLKPVREIICRI